MEWASKEQLEFYHCYWREKLAIIAPIEEPNSWACTFQCSECPQGTHLFYAIHSSGKSTYSNNKTSTETPEVNLRLAVELVSNGL